MKIISWNVNGIRSRIFNEHISSKIKNLDKILPQKDSPINELLENYDPDVFLFSRDEMLYH